MEIQVKYNNVENVIQDKIKEKKHEFLQDSFVSLLIGKPGSGKTHLIRQLLKNEKLYNKKFKRIYIFSPKPIDDLECELDRNYYNQFSIDKIYDIIDNNKKVKDCQILIIIDDFISKIKQEQNNPKLTQLFYNRRHLNTGGEISFIITTQKYFQFPASLRTCLTSLYIFEVTRKELNSINQDSGLFDAKMIKLLMTMVQKKPNSFIYIQLDVGKIFFNFDEIIF